MVDTSKLKAGDMVNDRGNHYTFTGERRYSGVQECLVMRDILGKEWLMFTLDVRYMKPWKGK